ncbi:MAG: RNA polymerase sigma factor [Candidatus Peribacteria bacterium]|nr:RNA polymerase sigma factor [Candidatus Peribacteria bacterium]
MDKIYRFVYLKTTNTEVAEDIVSDVFLSALDKVSSFRIDENSSVSAWFYRIAHNKVIDYYKVNKIYEDVDDYLDL